MVYVALLRGINVGGNRKVEMQKLKAFFESLGCTNVSTYINSGNVIFESFEPVKELLSKVPSGLEKTFGFEIPTLVKSAKEIAVITEAIPDNWENDKVQKTDIAYLFPEIDSPNFVDELPVNQDFLEVKYVKGAFIWNVKRENVHKSRLAKLIGHKLYKLMTIRNVNTAIYLAEKVSE